MTQLCNLTDWVIVSLQLWDADRLKQGDELYFSCSSCLAH